MKVTNIIFNQLCLFLIVNFSTISQLSPAVENCSESHIISAAYQSEQLQYKLDTIIKDYSIQQELNNYTNSPLLQKCAIGQYSALHHVITSCLDKITLHLNYWKTVQLSTLKYIITNPINAMSGKKSIQPHIDSLDFEQKLLADHLGTLKRAFDQDLSQQTNVYFLIDLIYKILTQQKSCEPCSSDITTEAIATERLNANFILLQKYEQQEKNIIQLHAKPSHVTRNWLSYSLGTIGLLAAGNYFYKNQHQIPTWKNQTADALSRFWQTHINDPIKNSWSILFSKHQQDDSSLATLRNSVEQEIRTMFNGSKNVTEEQIKQAIESVKNGNLPPIIMDDWNAKAHTSIATKLLSPSHSKSANIVIQAICISLLKKIENLELKHRLNIELTAIVPAVGLFGASAYILHKIYTLCAPQKNIQRPIKFTLRNIENILNKSRHKEHLNTQEEGFIIYYAHHLKSYIPWIPHKDRPTFLEDIAQLASSEFSITQKISIVERIDRTYQFLKENNSK